MAVTGHLCVNGDQLLTNRGHAAQLNSSAGRAEVTAHLRVVMVVITFHDTSGGDHPLHFTKHTGWVVIKLDLWQNPKDVTSTQPKGLMGNKASCQGVGLLFIKHRQFYYHRFHPASRSACSAHGASSLRQPFFYFICHGSVELNSPNFLFIIACRLIKIQRAVLLKAH